jgi:hypothetical protein
VVREEIKSVRENWEKGVWLQEGGREGKCIEFSGVGNDCVLDYVAQGLYWWGGRDKESK